MKQQTHITFQNPRTQKLAKALKCLPTTAEESEEALLSRALSIVRGRYFRLLLLDFAVLTLDPILMGYRLLSLMREYRESYPRALDDEILNWLFGMGDNDIGSYLFTEQEERILIRAVQEDVPFALDFSFCFFALKVIPAIRPYLYGIGRHNRQDVESALYMALMDRMYAFDLDHYDNGLISDYLIPSLKRAVFVQLGMEYPIIQTYSQMENIHSFHVFMQDLDFSKLPIEERARISAIPLRTALIYDATHGISGSSAAKHFSDINTAQDFIPFSSQSSVRSDLEMSLIENLHSFCSDSGHSDVMEMIKLLHDELLGHDSRYNTAPKIVNRILEKYRAKKDISDQDWSDLQEQVASIALLLLEQTDYFDFLHHESKKLISE